MGLVVPNASILNASRNLIVTSNISSASNRSSAGFTSRSSTSLVTLSDVSTSRGSVSIEGCIRSEHGGVLKLKCRCY